MGMLEAGSHINCGAIGDWTL